MSAVEQRTVSEVIVHTARTLPAAESGWSRRWFLRFSGGSEGAGIVLGEATLEQDFGELMLAMDGTGGTVADYGVEPDIGNTGSTDTLEGLLVRLSRKESDVSSTPFWYGIIHGHTVAPEGDDGGKATWNAVGLPSALDQIMMCRGWIVPISGADPFALGYLPGFNKLINGDRSTSTYDIGTETVYVHDLSTATGEGNYWTARQIADHILAGFSRPQLDPEEAFYGWTWQISDPDGCLSYIPEALELDGMTLLEGINTLINARRGLTWYFTVAADVVTINVLSAVKDAIVLPGFTLPASSQQIDLDTTGDVWVSNVVIDYDASTQCDILIIEGAHPFAGITWQYSMATGAPTGSLQGLGSGWTSADQSLWDSSPDRSLSDNAWRRFCVVDNWTGGQLPYVSATCGLADTFERSGVGDAAYGWQGLTGSRTHSGGSAAPPSAILKTERDLPICAGIVDSRLGNRQLPILVFYDGAGAYQDVTCGESSYHVSVDDGPPSVVIGTENNGLDAATRLDGVAGAEFYVTVGVREATPLRVSWQRDPTQWPRSLPRIKTIKVPHAELWYMTQDCVTGVTLDGTALIKSGAKTTVRDNTPTLRAVLALARGWYTLPNIKAGWTNRGILDISTTYHPGKLLTDLTRGRLYSVNNVITRRRWIKAKRNGCEMWDTAFETTRMIPDIEAVL